MITGRALSRDEIVKVWTIDRSEVIGAVYCLENGALEPKDIHLEYDLASSRRWNPRPRMPKPTRHEEDQRCW